jgi:hypothetical protein
MNRLLALMVVVLMAVDLITLTAVEKLSHRPSPPDLTPRVAQLETDLSQAQQDIGEMKQELALMARRGQAAD